MSRNTAKLVPDQGITVGDLITELCRWPDHATIKFRMPDGSAALCVWRVNGLPQGVVEIELHRVPETAPIVPA